MNRQVVAGILGLALAGCAQDRSVLRSQNANSKLGSVELTPAMPSIHEAINLDTDSLAGRTEVGPNPTVAAIAPTEPASASPAAMAEANPAPSVGGQDAPASIETQTASTVAPAIPAKDTTASAAANASVPQSPFAEPAPASATAPSSGPAMTAAAEPPPAPTMNAGNPEPTAPALPETIQPPVGRDPLLGANPDIMPKIELPPERLARNPSALPAVAPAAPSTEAPTAQVVDPAVAASGSNVPRSTAEASPAVAASSPPNPSMAVERDPLLGAHPDIMPSFESRQTPNTNQAGPPTATPASTEPPASQAPAPAEMMAQPMEQPNSPASVPVASPAPTPVTAPEPLPTTEAPTSSLLPAPTASSVSESAPAPSAPLDPAVSSASMEKVSPSPTTPSSAAPQTPTSLPTEPAPAAARSVETLPSPKASPEPTTPPADLLDQPVELPPLSSPDDAPTSALSPSQSAAAIDEPGTVLASSMFVEPGGASKTEKSPSITPEKAKTDKAVGDDPAAIQSKLPRRSVFEAGKAMARVGEEVITLRELKYAVKLRRASLPPGQQLSAEDNYMLAKSVLSDMVDRALVVQEAKRVIKNKKQLQMFMDMADKVWKDEELPVLLRQYHVTNIYELKEKLIEKDDSIEQLREAYRQDFLFRGFIDQKLSPKMKVELPEMIDYYNEHLKDFDQAAQITWREIAIDSKPGQDRDATKKKADVALARLRRGDDFAKVASEMSDGPNKAKGGLWKTAPGSYNVAAVNAVLENLPIGKFSQVIDSPTGFHIVRVDARRPAGPQTFAEVQDDIRRIIRGQKVREQSTAYLDSLRKKTPVTTVFDEKEVVQRASVEVDSTGPKTASK